MPQFSQFTQAQLTALTNAIATGAKEVVNSSGQKTVFNSTEDMLSLRDRMVRELQSQGDGIPRPNAHRSSFHHR